MARTWELCRAGNDALWLDSIFTTVRLVVSGLFLPGAWPVNPNKHSVILLAIDRMRVVVVMGISSSCASEKSGRRITFIRDRCLEDPEEPRAMIQRCGVS
jgi:hypothetical protein